MKLFERWLTTYEQTVQKKDWNAEEQENKKLDTLLKEYEQKKKELEGEIAKEESVKHKAHLMLGLIMLTATLLLFKETKEIAFSIEIFEHRASPFNVFYPFRLKA